jgi:hypothetical protein
MTFVTFLGVGCVPAGFACVQEAGTGSISWRFSSTEPAGWQVWRA